jgi:hypothetical protein
MSAVELWKAAQVAETRRVDSQSCCGCFVAVVEIRSRGGITEARYKNFSSAFNMIYSASSNIIHRTEIAD